MGENKLHVGIIGAGRIGKIHSETLAFQLPEAVPLLVAHKSYNEHRPVRIEEVE